MEELTEQIEDVKRREEVRDKAEKIKNTMISLRQSNLLSNDGSSKKETVYEKLRMQRRGMLWAIGDIDSIEDSAETYKKPEKLVRDGEERLVLENEGTTHIVAHDNIDWPIASEDLSSMEPSHPTLCGRKFQEDVLRTKRVNEQTKVCKHCKRVYLSNR